jgi:hypothetical protein
MVENIIEAVDSSKEDYTEKICIREKISGTFQK